ncbi:MAG: alanine:cation symporter family protein, partial [Planctomycetes bacterium]|nr:alanine:cation symporter family protein [Planctomycetota bacterium]
INHFQGLCAGLNAPVELGNIAGVAVAVSIGGPGAVFWMWVVGVFGMALKFMECTLAVMYRDVRAGGEVRGGPMWYMQKALVEPMRKRGSGLWVVFKVLAVLFAISTMLNSFGGGNMFQGWNVKNTLASYFHVDKFVSATVVSVLVAMVIIGGIKRIGQVASKLVPFMCVLYVAGALYVILGHAADIPYHIGTIFKSAFTPTAEAGGFVGATVWLAFQQGLKRACFSNEAGEGSAAMAHAAARTEEPIREGVVAGIGPFIDTIVICTMSALVLLMSGAWNRPALGTVVSVDGSTVVVRCEGEIPSKMEALYFDRCQPPKEKETPRKLTLRTVQTNAAGEAEAKKYDVAISAWDRDESHEGWASVRTVTLDLKDMKEKKPADFEAISKYTVGQPVHLAMNGADLTAFAFDTSIKGFGKWIVTLGVCLFAFSTMISWSYYGETGAEYLFGPRAILPYKFVFVVFVFLGMVLDSFTTVYEFSDGTTGLMVLCNLPVLLMLSPAVIRAAKDYFGRLDKGDMPRLR